MGQFATWLASTENSRISRRRGRHGAVCSLSSQRPAGNAIASRDAHKSATVRDDRQPARPDGSDDEANRGEITTEVCSSAALLVRRKHCWAIRSQSADRSIVSGNPSRRLQILCRGAAMSEIETLKECWLLIDGNEMPQDIAEQPMW